MTCLLDLWRDRTAARFARLLRFSLHEPWPTSTATRIQLCGRLAVELAGRELTPKLPGGQARVLFTYLTVNRALPVRREELIEALWPWRAPAGADACAQRAALAAALRARRARCSAVAARSSFALPPRRVDRSRGGRRGDPPRRGGRRPARVGARLGAFARRAVHRAPRLPPRRGSPVGPGAPRGGSTRFASAALECYAAVALGVGGSELAPGRAGRARAHRRARRTASGRTRCSWSSSSRAATEPRRCASTSRSANVCGTTSARRPRPSSRVAGGALRC